VSWLSITWDIPAAPRAPLQARSHGRYCDVYGRVQEFTDGKASESMRRWKRRSRERSSLGCGGSSRLQAFGGDASRHHRVKAVLVSQSAHFRATE
jgi:hypothetical protein